MQTSTIDGKSISMNGEIAVKEAVSQKMIEYKMDNTSQDIRYLSQ